MESTALILVNLVALFPVAFVTWLSWKDARTAFRLLGELDTRVYILEQRMRILDEEKILKS